MTDTTCILIGAPVDCGKRRLGCLMGPDAFRAARLPEALRSLGHDVIDRGNLRPADHPADADDAFLHKLNETVGWTKTLMQAATQEMAHGLPIFLGGDHALALGTVPGVAAFAKAQGRPQFVLWLDAHTDYHSPQTTGSGNLHGTPVGYFTGRSGFDAFPPPAATVPAENICMIGLRSVDPEERTALDDTPIARHDMREIDERGIARPLQEFLTRVADANGFLHVSLDVDFIDPAHAPGVGTTVPGGATVREAHLVMEMIHDSGLMTSLDVVELNPFLDDRGQTAHLMVDLVASALGRTVFDRPTRGRH
ncbi:arginase [Aliishimia ponticola]|uniref:Arginase n=1 Tax=Aliishimia ponticola TaxID=2499833 RepID=A0A4S4NGG8_9RHOB|nr:arginase [Aliishimia ponticola]THH38756.1 arginase [Aliishimia ponticola]